ncbi:MAG: NUDIX hydrolase [Planctomycetota bacterium]
MPLIRHPFPPSPDGAVALISRACDPVRFLVIRRALTIDAPGWLCFPGGRIQSNEMPEQAAVRETLEETGLRVRAIRQVWTCRLSQGASLDWFLCRTIQPDPVVSLNLNEADAFFWLTLEEIRGLDKTLPSIPVFLSGVETGAINLRFDEEAL